MQISKCRYQNAIKLLYKKIPDRMHPRGALCLSRIIKEVTVHTKV